MQQTSRPASAVFLICVSAVGLLGTIAAYSISDVHNNDVIAPIIGILQFIIIFGLFKGKLWGLIGYTVLCIGLLAAIFIYSVPKGETGKWTVPLSFVVLLSLLAVDYWTRKRNYFN